MNRMRALFFAGLIACSVVGGSTAAVAAEWRWVPPNMLGLMLTMTGFDGKIYPPGKVDIGTEWWGGYGNYLYLIPRSGFFIKEQFLSRDLKNPNDPEDHRCIVGPRREPMALDVRLIFALPDYAKPEGIEAIMRLALLGNPVASQREARVMHLDAATVYEQQVQQQVRGKIREVCVRHESVDAVYTAIGNGSFTAEIRKEVAQALRDNSTPLRLLDAVASNVKPDPKVLDGIALALATEKQVIALERLATSISQDQTGVRKLIYRLWKLEDMIRQGKSGSNTIFMTSDFMTDGTPAGAPVSIPVPLPARPTPAPEQKK